MQPRIIPPDAPRRRKLKHVLAAELRDARTAAFSPEYSRREIRGTYTRDTNQPNANVFMRFYPERPALRVAFLPKQLFRVYASRA